MKWLKVLLFTGSLIFFFVGDGWAKDVEVYVDPSQCYIYGEVRVFGFVKPRGRGSTYARLEFLKPQSQKTITKRIRTEPNGEYEFVFDETTEAGNWTVTAWKDGTNRSAKATFEVTTAVLMSPMVQEMESLNTKQSPATQEFKNNFSKYPDFPGKDKMLNDTLELLNKLNEFKQTLSALDKAVHDLEDALIKHQKEIPVEAQKLLAEASAEATNLQQEIRRQMVDIDGLIKESQTATEWCFMWESYSLIFDRFGKLLNYADTGIKNIYINLLKAKAQKGLPFEVKTAIGTVDHLISAGSPMPMLAFFKFVMGIVADLGKEIADSLVTKHCVKYEGKVTGNYQAQLLHQGMPFLKMSYKIKSDVVSLIFQKREHSELVYLKGRIKGWVQNFKCSMTMIPFDLGPTIAPSWCRTPVPILSSRAFFISLKGKALADRLEIEVDEIGYDFKLSTRGYYVTLSPQMPETGLIGDIEFPLMNAEWFFTRITHLSNPNVEFITLSITKEGDKSVAKKDFKRKMHLPETHRRKGVKVEMDMEFRVCQPGCK